MKKTKVYLDKIAKSLTEQFKYTNVMQVPRLEKVCINAGIGDAASDAKLIEQAAKEIEQIIFTEINFDEIKRVRGFNITFVTSTNNKEETKALLKAIGLPIVTK